MKIIFLLCLCIFGCASIEITGVNDSLDRKIKVSTYEYDKPAFGIIIGGTYDAFLRAYIDKIDKHIVYHVYVTFNSHDWIFWDKVNFENGDLLKSCPVNRVDMHVVCSEYGCAHYEDVVFPVERKWLEKWKNEKKILRFSSTYNSTKRDVELYPDEVKLFLDTIDKIINEI